MSNPDTLQVTGVPGDPQMPFDLNCQWNLISYLPGAPDSTRHALEGILDNLIVALGFDGGGLTFDPELPDNVNTLNIMSPKFGYWVKVDEVPDTLVYPENPVAMSIAALAKASNQGQSASSEVHPTNEWISLYGIDIKVDNELLPVGTVVKAIDEDDVVCGEFVVTVAGTFGLMPIYQNDPATNHMDEGGEPGDRITIYFDDFSVPVQIEWTQMGDVIDFGATVAALGIELLNIPKTYGLSQNYPNPFNPVTTIKYQLPKESEVNMKVFNIMGQEVRTLVSRYQPAGYYQIVWDGRNNYRQEVASGVYIYHFRADKYVRTMKMIILK